MPPGGPAPASPTRRSACPFPVAWPGVCPALGTGGRWMPWHANRPPGASGRANEVGHGSGLPAIGRLGSRVGWWGACGWGSGMPAPAGQIPPPWAWWENEAPATRAARSSPQVQPSGERTRYTAVASSPRLVLGHCRPSGSTASAARTWRSSSSGPPRPAGPAAPPRWPARTGRPAGWHRRSAARRAGGSCPEGCR
jgi:hypothetical protein